MSSMPKPASADYITRGGYPSIINWHPPSPRQLAVSEELERVMFATPYELAVVIVDLKQIIRNLQERLNNAPDRTSER